VKLTERSSRRVQNKFFVRNMALFHSLVPDSLPFFFHLCTFYILWLYYIPRVQSRLCQNCFSQSATLHNISIRFYLLSYFSPDVFFLRVDVSFFARHIFRDSLKSCAVNFYIMCETGFCQMKISLNLKQSSSKFIWQLTLWVSTCSVNMSYIRGLNSITRKTIMINAIILCCSKILKFKICYWYSILDIVIRYDIIHIGEICAFEARYNTFINIVLI